MDELTRILDAAELLFRKYGIRSVTMSDISRHLGMSKKTLYLHIENKEQLIEKALLRHFEGDRQIIERARQTAANALDELLQMNAEVQKKIRTIHPGVIYDLKKYHAGAWKHFEEFQTNFVYGCIRSNLERGIQEGYYRSDINPDILSRIYVGFFPVFTDYELFPPERYPQVDLYVEFMRYHLHGILSERGRALLSQIDL